MVVSRGWREVETGNSDIVVGSGGRQLQVVGGDGRAAGRRMNFPIKHPNGLGPGQTAPVLNQSSSLVLTGLLQWRTANLADSALYQLLHCASGCIPDY